MQEESTPKRTPTRARTAGVTPGSSAAKRVLGRTPPPHDESKFPIAATPSTPEEHQIFDDEDVPITRGEFRKLRKQLKETRTVVQDLWRQQQQIAEDADTWIRVAQQIAKVARDDIKEARSEMRAKLEEVTDVFRVHRDLIDELRTELGDHREEWADDIVARVVEEVNDNITIRVSEELDPEKIWADLTDKEY